MGTSLAALLIMAVFFTGVILLYRTTLSGNVNVSNAIRESANQAAERARTDLRITGLNTDECNVLVSIENRGAVPVSDYDNMDVIVTIDTLQGTLTARKFPLTQQTQPVSGALTQDTWSLNIDPNVYPYEPLTFNPGESGTLRVNWPVNAQIPPPAQGYGEVRSVTVGAPNGSSTDYAASIGNVLSPCNGQP